MKYFLTCLAIVLVQSAFAQNSSKKVIDNQAYDIWKSIQQIEWSKDGRFITYQVRQPKGDSWLYFLDTETNHKDSIFKGKKAEIHSDAKYAVFKISPGYDTIRQLKLKDTKPNKLPKDSLGIIWFGKDSIVKIPQVKSFSLAEKGNWIAYLSEKDKRPECPKYKKWQIFKKRRQCDRPKTSGQTLTIYNPLNDQKETIHRVVNYRFNKPGNMLFYSTSIKGDADTLSLYALNLDDMTKTKVISNQLDISSFSIDENGNQLAFTTSNDTNKIKTYRLAYWVVGDSAARILVDTNTTGLKQGWAVSEYSNTYFSKSGEQIYFGTNKIVEQEPEDSLLESEKAKVDVWSWTDKKIQPQQLKQLKRTQKKSYETRYNLISHKITHLVSKENERVFVDADLERPNALIRNSDPYLKSNSWEFPWKADYAIIDLETGSKEIILEGQAYYPSLSPSGNYLVWYNGKDSCWMSTNTKDKTVLNLTSHIKANFYDDNNGNPSLPFPKGSVGWTNSDGNERILIRAEFDIYEINPADNNDYNSVTKELGKPNQISYVICNFDKDSVYINLNRVLFIGRNEKTRAEFLIKNLDFSNPQLAGDYTFWDMIKAELSNKIVYRISTVSQYPDLMITDLDFNQPTQITNVNSQQKDYNWSTVEQVKWKSYQGLELDGLLYKPENFDATKQYPMIVYFYEKNDDRLHHYYAPKPTASIVYPTEYASNGYIVFIPNILYTPGHPAKSAFDCIVSGTDYLTNKYPWIDTSKLGLQGQSWGGYQTAQLITMTNKYACGMAGAPVSNMFSAYGGIRWGSGMSRMFQYERTQSRIGCTIWDCPELYIENSPIFGLPKVTTPLLIMHNDNDGAVPWYQGIEMFMGLRRLEKPVWMLNYNGDQHNLMQNANREDLSLRMRQFFNHYLKDEPMPLWMKEGVPAIDKGDPSNLELESTE